MNAFFYLLAVRCGEYRTRTDHLQTASLSL